MKKSLLILSVVLSSSTFAQDCTKLFISEYVEGWSNNKALEIYNPTNAPINLADYVVARYSNGSNSATEANSVQLSGTIPAKNVFVAVLDQRIVGGTGQNAPVWDSLQAKADGFFAPDYNVSTSFYWNGDDCIVLLKGTLTGNPAQVVATIPGMQVIDIFGKIGEQPTNINGGTSSPTGGWSTLAPHSGGASGGAIVTVDHSMIRKASVKKGVINPAITVFNPLAEYDSIPAVIVRLDSNGDTIFGATGNPILDGNWNSLGTHLCDCNPPLSIENKKQSVLSLFPNPSTGVFFIKGLNEVDNIIVYNTLGQKVANISINGKATASFELDLKGVYIVQLNHSNGEITTKKVIVK